MKNPLTDYDRLRFAIGRGLGCACDLCCDDIEIEIAALKKKAAMLDAAMRFVPPIEAAEAILADEDAPAEFRGEAELVKWLRGKE